MTYVVTEKCVDCKFTSCVSVCPVDAFHELPDRLYINPETCIDCNACMDECPVEAIFPDMDVPDELQDWIELNEKAEDYPQIVGQIDALKGPKCVDPDADRGRLAAAGLARHAQSVVELGLLQRRHVQQVLGLPAW